MNLLIKDEYVLKYLIDALISEINKNEIIKDGFNPETVLFDIYSLNNNRKSKLFQSSSGMFLPQNMRDLLNTELVQQLDIDGKISYTLSLQGLVESIERFYNIPKIEQLNKFLKLSDKRYQSITVTGELNWREKLALTTLIVLGCVSIETSMNLNNQLNREHFEEILQELIKILEKHNILEKDHSLPETRGEPGSALFMRSRINELPQKTNHIYKYLKGGEGYYIDVLTDGNVDQSKMRYLLTKIFVKFDPTIDYTALKNELVDSGRTYQTKFLSVSLNSKNLIQIINALEEFFNKDIWNLT